jgi:hypothetical protein
MDEKTEQLTARFPEDLVAWLKGVASARGWRLSRTLRWAVREAMIREEEDREEAEWRRQCEEEIDERSGRFAFEGDDGPDDIDEMSEPS